MLIKRPPDVRPSEITDRRLYLRRRELIGAAAAGAAALALGPSIARAIARPEKPTSPALEGVVEGPFSTDEELTRYKDITRYNNFYEFGTGKRDPEMYSGKFKPRPWTLRVDGECAKPGEIDLEDLIAPHRLEERIYRLRCVEAWSMVVPWVGIPLGDMLKRFEPTSKAKYVAFRTIFRPAEMPGQNRRYIEWPYVEGLRIDEAMNPLTLMSVGLYGEVLPNQNGAPMRLVVPWKYGFKSIKSIVAISFTETEPPTSWNIQAPGEYGFYANVNPEVDHPRWSQRRERRIGEVFKRNTLMFNGYGDQVADMYAGMNLRKLY